MKKTTFISVELANKAYIHLLMALKLTMESAMESAMESYTETDLFAYNIATAIVS